MTSTVDLEILSPDPPARWRSSRASRICEPLRSAVAYFEESLRAASSIDLDAVELAAAILLKAYTGGAAVFSCGNGGSASVANHLQCDHTRRGYLWTDTDLKPRVTKPQHRTWSS